MPTRQLRSLSRGNGRMKGTERFTENCGKEAEADAVRAVCCSSCQRSAMMFLGFRDTDVLGVRFIGQGQGEIGRERERAQTEQCL